VNWLKDLYDAEKTEQDNQQGLDKPYSVYIDSVSSDSEKVTVRNHSTRGRELSISHPFISTGSWIRALPEVGAQYMATNRADDSDPQLLSSINKTTEVRVTAYRDRLGVFRSLSPGEIEISSSGLSQAFFSSRAFNAVRAGLLLRTMNQDELTIMDRSPIQTKQFLNYKAGELGDEYRIGIVSRPKNSWKTVYPKINDKFLAEEFINLVNPALSAPKTLFSIQRGHVVDKGGLPIKQKKTALPLRSVQNFYATDDTFTTFEIDQSGNYLIQTAQAATDGMQIEIPNGNLVFKVKKDWNSTIEGNRGAIIKGTDSTDVGVNKKTKVAKTFSVETETMTFKVTKELTINAGGTTVKVTADGNVDVKTVKDVTLNGQAGMVLTTMTDPVIDLITGVPTEGVINVKAGM
jgi:hypothetical protein